MPKFVPSFFHQVTNCLFDQNATQPLCAMHGKWKCNNLQFLRPCNQLVVPWPSWIGWLVNSLKGNPNNNQRWPWTKELKLKWSNLKKKWSFVWKKIQYNQSNDGLRVWDRRKKRSLQKSAFDFKPFHKRSTWQWPVIVNQLMNYNHCFKTVECDY